MRPAPFRFRVLGHWPLIAAPILAAVALPAAVADAQTYDVWSCRAPDGSPAIVRDDGGGWVTRSVSSDAGGVNKVEDGCAALGALQVEHVKSGSQPVKSASGFQFLPPAATSVVRYEVAAYGRLRGTRPGQGAARGFLSVGQTLSEGGAINGLVLEGQPHSLSELGDVAITPTVFSYAGAPGGSDLLASIGCLGNEGDRCFASAEGPAAALTITRSTITLRDTQAPVVTSVQGDAVNAGIWPRSGAAMTVAATDRGGGVLRVGVEIDGGEPQWHPVAAAPCRIWPGTTRAFVAPRPCPTASSTPLTIPTVGLNTGVHSVRVLVEDAAGNQTTAYGPASKRISDAVGPGGDAVGGDPAEVPTPGSLGDPVAAAAAAAAGMLEARAAMANDPGPLNGMPASSAVRLGVRWEGTASTLRRVRYGQRPVLRGRLTTTDGRPVRDAAIRVGVVQDHRSAQRVEYEALRTDAAGGFRWLMPKGIGSRRITLAYYEHVAGSTPAASTTVRLQVAAAVRMTLDRRTARQGQAVRLRGSLVGRPLPKVGSVIELQARNPGRKWITFRTVRANRAGRFAAGYRFRMPGPAVFEMRARVRRSGDYPYTTGVSPHRRIAVR